MVDAIIATMFTCRFSNRRTVSILLMVIEVYRCCTCFIMKRVVYKVKSVGNTYKVFLCR